MRLALTLLVFVALASFAAAKPATTLFGPNQQVPHVPIGSTEADGDVSEWDTTVDYANPQYHRYIFNSAKIDNKNQNPGFEDGDTVIPTGNDVLGHVFMRFECSGTCSSDTGCAAEGSLFVLYLLDDPATSQLMNANADGEAFVRLFFNNGDSFRTIHVTSPSEHLGASFITRADGTTRGFEMEIKINSGETDLSVATHMNSGGNTIGTAKKPGVAITIDPCQPQDPDDPIDPVTIPGEIAGNIFEDCTPNDGIYDLANESPVQGVTVQLFQCVAGSFDPSASPADTATTDANGYFSFDSLNANEQFAVVASLPGTAQLGAAGAGADGEIDNDATVLDSTANNVRTSSGCKLPTREQGPMVTDVVDQAFDVGFCDDGQVTGDPHLTGFLGQKMNLLGEDGHVYNLISSPHLQYNARLNQTMYKVHKKHATLISEMGMLVGENQVRIYFASPEAEEIVVEVNGARIMPGDNEPVLLSEDGSEWIMRTPRARSVLIVTRDYHFNVQGKLRMLRHLDDGVHLVDWVAGATHHGMLGQTASPEKADKSSKEYVVDFEWPFYLDGSLADYDVAGGDIFGTDYTFSQFDASA